jgi:hypothetical protein
MCAITAKGTLNGQELSDIPVLNPGDGFGKTWLLEIGGSYFTDSTTNSPSQAGLIQAWSTRPRPIGRRRRMAPWAWFPLEEGPSSVEAGVAPSSI